MPDVREVYEMVTQQTPPKPDALERQRKRQRRATRNTKIGAIGIAATIAATAIVLILVNRPGESGTTAATDGDPASPIKAPEAAAPVGTVTFDGSTCSIEITADQIEPGVVLFDAVNATEQRVMFDSWQLLEGYPFRAFEAVVERSRRIVENGKEFPTPGFWPGETEVTYLGSNVIPAHGSGSIVGTMSPGRHAIVCLQRYEGQRDFQAFGIAGPIAIGSGRIPPRRVA
jgi:hypothetical protein